MRNSATLIGLAVGIALGFALVFGGFQGFVVVAVFAAVGVLVGRVADGELDLTEYLGGKGRRDR
ncbi:hypothetical protein [Jatrophihabitans fulvus]